MWLPPPSRRRCAKSNFPWAFLRFSRIPDAHFYFPAFKVAFTLTLQEGRVIVGWGLSPKHIPTEGPAEHPSRGPLWQWEQEDRVLFPLTLISKSPIKPFWVMLWNYPKPWHLKDGDSNGPALLTMMWLCACPAHSEPSIYKAFQLSRCHCDHDCHLHCEHRKTSPPFSSKHHTCPSLWPSASGTPEPRKGQGHFKNSMLECCIK